MKKLVSFIAAALFLVPMLVMGQGQYYAPLKDIQGNPYQYAKIGTHFWMASNLKTSTDNIAPLFCNDEYGCYYDWTTVMNGQTTLVDGHIQGICPDGWYLPTQDEWTELKAHNQLDLNATTKWQVPGTNGTGLTLLPSGYYKNNTRVVEDATSSVYLWMVETNNLSTPREIWSNCHCSMMNVLDANTNDGLAVRCVRLIPVLEMAESYSTDTTTSSIKLHGNLTCNVPTMERGFVCSVNDNPRLIDNGVVVSKETTPQLGAFDATIEDLESNKQYYYVAYTVTSLYDTLYSASKTFRTFAVQSVTTNTCGVVTTKSAKVSGVLVNPDNLTITEIGFLYGTNNQPSFENATKAAASVEQFNDSITGLTPNTTYYFRAYAINEYKDTVMGNVENFTTKDLQTVTTKIATDTTANSVTLNGNVTVSSDYNITANGFVYGTNDFSNKIAATPSTVGDFSANLTGLTANTIYQFKAFSVNQYNDTVYGDVQTVKTKEVESFTITTGDAQEQGKSGKVTFNGTLSNITGVTEVGFQVGSTTSYGITIRANKALNVVQSSGNKKFETGTYHYRIYCIKGGQTYYGDDKTVTVEKGDN